MKLKIGRLKQVIQEAIGVAKCPKIVLGGVYYNSKGHTINIEFIQGDHVGYELLSNGNVGGADDATMSQLRTLLVKGGFKFDHKETW